VPVHRGSWGGRAVNRLPAHRQVIHGRTHAQSWAPEHFDPIQHYPVAGSWIPRLLSMALALACGIGAALVALSWLTPCEAGALCAAPIATQRGRLRLWLRRVSAPVRAWMLRVRINSLLHEVHEHELMADISPRLAKLARVEADALLCELRSLELDARQR